MKNTCQKITSFVIMAGLTLGLSGCVTINLGSAPTAIVNETPTQLPDLEEIPTTLPQSPGLTEAALLNGRYLSPLLQQPIQLVEGTYEGMVEGVELNARVQPGIQFGDLNADGISDAAFLLAEDTGGSGVFVSLVVIYSRGEYFQQAQGILIDDRPVINAISIENGVVKITGLVHGPNDPMVDPTTSMSVEFTLFGDQMVRTWQKSAFEGSAEHLIVIESPFDGEEVFGSFTLKGFMPIGPFENNLALTILDKSNAELVREGFMVEAVNMGAPAIFDNLIELPAVQPGTELLVILSELSMADRSPIAIDAVRVIVK